VPDLERILQLTPGTLSQQWYEDGAAVDPGAATVGITRADGTILVAAGTATAGTGTAPRTFNLTTTHTALLDRLTVTWTSVTKGTIVSYVEVVGGFWFSLADGNVVVGFEHGRDRPPERLRRAALLLAKVWLVSGPVDDRTSTLTSDGGTFSLVTPGRGGSIFGVPEVDAAVQANLLPAIA
jgi:hypothetical protein